MNITSAISRNKSRNVTARQIVERLDNVQEQLHTIRDMADALVEQETCGDGDAGKI